MSRHRNVRSMNYTDEYDGYDDVYGHSLDDDYCISPSDAAFIYDRDGSRGQQKMGTFLKSDEDIAEEDETDIDKHSELDDIEKAKLNSCIEKIKSVIGEVKISEQEITSLILKMNFEVEKVIDYILSASKFAPQNIFKKKDDNLFNSKIKDQLSTSPLNVPIRKFNVPKLFGLPKKSPENNLTSDSSSHTSLSSLVSSHLGTQPLSKLNLNSNDDFEIDLTQALLNVSIKSKPRRLVENEVFFPKTIIPTVHKQKSPKIMCQFDLSQVLQHDNNLETHVSRFGKIICRKYKCRSPGYFRENSENNVKNLFLFDNPSPDDLILKFLRRK